MGKITFRADDDLVDELESLDASKSEVMREALRSYLDTHANGGSRAERRRSTGSHRGRGSGVDELVGELVDELVRERVDDLLVGRTDERDRHERHGASDVNVTISLESVADERKTTVERAPAETPPHSHDREPEFDVTPTQQSCEQCGEHLNGDHVYCPNCGEKASRRLFCECGDEVRSDWSFCPGCGRRTPAADVLDSERL